MGRGVEGSPLSLTGSVVAYIPAVVDRGAERRGMHLLCEWEGSSRCRGGREKKLGHALVVPDKIVGCLRSEDWEQGNTPLPVFSHKNSPSLSGAIDRG